MNINELTIGEAREIAALINSGSGVPQIGGMTQTQSPYNIGKNYFIRTVTHHHTGKRVDVTQQELILENAAWIADDGRLTEALAKSEFKEVEMFPVGSRVIVGRAAVIDAVEISTVPTSQK